MGVGVGVGVRFGVLGPLAVWTDDGRQVEVAEPKVRALLADLLASGGGPVSVDRLIDDLWRDRPSRNPVGTLQARISQLRRALGDPALIVHGPSGYRLKVADSDADRFRQLVNRRSADLRERAAQLDEALALWRGPAYADFADQDWARPEIAHLEESRLSALEEQAEVLLALGADVDVSSLAVRHPLRERLHGLHMRALYRAGRQSDALAAFAELRERLASELGLDPSPELARLHEAILRQDPALAAQPSRTNLPASLAPLIGRDADVTDLRDLLTATRLVTLTGPGGVGKTSLALETARTLATPAPTPATGPAGPPSATDRPSGERGASSRVAPVGVGAVERGGGFADGVWLVELAGAGDVAEAVAAVLGIRDDASVPLTERLAGALAGKRMLLVVDNCEHLVEQAAEVVSRLLRAAPGLRVLATGQEPLGVTGEHVRVVPPLPEPAAVRLFAARAGVEPGEAVSTICRRLDGIPLALELAATRARALGVQELADRLDDRFRLLNSGMRDAPARHRTLRAMIDWSWELLGDHERIVLRRLAAHADGCTLEAAEEVCAEPGVDVLGALARLVERSLVTPGPRYRLLESVAAYCVERLREAGEHDLIMRRHASYYTALAERAELRGPRQRDWLRRLDPEVGALRVQRDWLRPLRLANALAWYWFLRGRLGEARRSLAAALEAQAGTGMPGAGGSEAARASVWLAGTVLSIGEVAPPVRVSGLDRSGRALADWFLSHVHWAYGDLQRHEAAVGRALEAYGELGDRWGVAAALGLRAKLALVRGDLDAMRRDGERSLALFRELGDGWGQIEAMDSLDRLAEIRGDYAEAKRLREEALYLAEELGLDVAFKLSALGRIALLAGEYERADDYHERARRRAVEQSYKAAEEHAVLGLALSARRQGRYERAEEYLLPWLDWLRQVGGTPGIAFVLAELGFAAEQRGDAETALSRQRAGHEAARAYGDPRAVALSLEGLSGALRLSGDPAQAATLLGRAEALREATGAPLPPSERLDVDRIAAALRDTLGEPAFERCFAAGREEGQGRGNSAATSQAPPVDGPA
ncbi:BTAD domain-containing putative transcriptional regulator [Nonomuraea sp. NPDC005983]|uniref:BTAD domain-containing putative transcriptional regulator n=1 Tax=Nonomuraea sp. NPDC005983 TaxID=3155595 RepID=UPI0033B35F74